MKVCTPLLGALALLVAAGTAHAQSPSPQQHQACENDAFRLCGQAIPDRHKVFACLKQHLASLSAPCHSAMARYANPHQSSTVGSGSPGGGGHSPQSN